MTFGPLTRGQCDAIFSVTDMIIIWILLLASVSLILRSLFAFTWKRVHGFNDTLIARFISVNLVVISSFLSLTGFMFGRHRGTIWFICAQEPEPEQNPILDLDHSLAYRKPGDPTILVIAALICLVSYLTYASQYAWYKIKHALDRYTLDLAITKIFLMQSILGIKQFLKDRTPQPEVRGLKWH